MGMTSRRTDAERLLDLLEMQRQAMSVSTLTAEEAEAAYKRYMATREQILELMGVD